MELRIVIPRHGGMQNYERMKFLFEMITKHVKPITGVALEIGCAECGSTVYLAKACIRKKITRIFAIDTFNGTPGVPQRYDCYELARRTLTKHHLLRHVELIRANSSEYPWREGIDVLHIDADHSFDAVQRDIRKYSPFVSVGGIVILDDYDASHQGVRKATDDFINDNEAFEIIGINYQGDEGGSICLQRRVQTS